MNKYAHQINQVDSSEIAQNSKSAIYFKSVCHAFEQAVNVSSRIDYFFNIGGFTIKFCFAGPALVPSFTKAFEHLSVPSVSVPDFTILLWDSFSTGITMPPPPWEVDEYIARGEIWRFNNEHRKIRYTSANDTYYMLDRSLNTAIYRVDSAENVPQYEKGSPLLAILHWWMVDHDRCLVHGGAVGNADGGVLLVGKGGSGKSTTALACLNSDLLYVSDDYCLISNNTGPCAHSIYCTGKVNAKDIKKFPFLNSAIVDSTDPDSGKALFFFSKSFPEKISSGFPIRAILIPHVTNVLETSIERATSAAAFRAVAPSTIFQLSVAKNQLFRCLSEVVRQVPCYVLKVGTDLEKIPAVISKLLSGT